MVARHKLNTVLALIVRINEYRPTSTAQQVEMVKPNDNYKS